jgi:phosphoribosylformimino-5-aminoimidazole carboxamide ribotide isomerase
MLIPSIDLQQGKVVQLVQGDRRELASDDLDGWIARFSSFPLVQLIDLDSAMGTGHNDDLVRYVCQRLPVQVGGGVRTIDRARLWLEAGARRVILGSSLFTHDAVRVDQAEAFSAALGADRLIAAVDSRGGLVTIKGWKVMTTIRAVDAVRALTPHVGAFLYTHVETEGTLAGLNLDAVTTIAAATSRKIIAAGGIRSMDEVETLDALGIDAVVGMAIYKGVIKI